MSCLRENLTSSSYGEGLETGRASNQVPRQPFTRQRTNAWLGNFRRLVVRYDRSLTIYGAFFHIACFMIVLRRVVP